MTLTRFAWMSLMTTRGLKKLYEARGFVAKKHNDYRRFKGLIGFSGATTMVFNVRS